MPLNLGLGTLLGMENFFALQEKAKKDKSVAEQQAFENLMREKLFGLSERNVELGESREGRAVEEVDRLAAMRKLFGEKQKEIGMPISTPSPFGELLKSLPVPGAQMAGEFFPSTTRPRTREEVGRQTAGMIREFPERRQSLESSYKLGYPEKEKKGAWENKVDIASTLFANGKITSDGFLKIIGGYIAPDKKSDFVRKLEVAKTQGYSKDEIKKIVGAYIDTTKNGEEKLSWKEKEEYKTERTGREKYVGWFMNRYVTPPKGQNYRRITPKEKPSIDAELKKFNKIAREHPELRLPEFKVEEIGGPFTKDFYTLVPKTAGETETGGKAGAGKQKGTTDYSNLWK